MKFYSTIASYYDLLFPYDQTQINFLHSVLHTEGQDPVSHHRYIDIGCGTGTILSAFTDRFDKLYGLDFDEELLALAAEKMYPGLDSKVELLNDDMMELTVLFPEEAFSFITCLGNTLPHLTKPGQVSSFIHQVYQKLESGGVFVFQIVNYDRVLNTYIRDLPTIERDQVRFERHYSLPNTEGLLDFETVLRDGKENIEISNTIALNPLRKIQLQEYIQTAGFTDFSFFGDYTGADWTDNSFLLICVCKKR